MSIYMLFVNKLMTIIGLGEMLMVLSQQLPTVSKTDSAPDIVNGAATLISETDGFLAKKTLGGVDLNTMSSNKRHLKRTRRKKRNFVKVFNKFNNISTSKPSTCTPFFVHQTKMASRKRNRLKKPMHLAAEQDSIITTNKSTKEKGKIRKLFLPKNHSTISLSVANSSKLLDDKDKRKTTITYDFLKHLSETISSNESAPGTDGRLHFTLVEDCVNSDPLAIEYNISTVRTKSNRATSEMQHPTTNNNLKNLDNQSNESPMCLINVSNTPNESTGYKAKFKLDRFYIKNIFHVTKTSSSTFSDSIGLPKTPTETGVVIQYYNTLAETCPMEYTTPKNTTELVIENSEFTSSTPTNTFKLIKMFNKLKPFKRVFTISTREPADLITEEPVLYETQILPSPSQRTVGKENSRGRILSSAKLSKDSLGSKHVPNMLHNDQQTTLTDINSSLIFEGNTRFTMKQINGDTNFFSEPSLTPSTIQGKCELHSFSKHDRKDFMGHVLKYGKQNAEDKKETIHSLFKTTVGNKMKGFYQNSVNGTVGSIQKVRSEETLNNNGENTKRSHSPFRVKYLIKFRRPTYCSQSSRDLTFADLTSNESFNKGKVNSVSKRHFTFNVTTEPMNTKNNLTVHSDSKSSTASNNDPAIHKFNQTQFTMATDHFQHHSKIKVDGNIGLCGTTKDTLTAGNKLFEDAQSSLSFTESGLGRYKSQTKNKNREHYTRIPTSSKIKGSMKQNTEVDFKEKFNVTVYKDNSERFRNWFLRKTTRLPNIRYGKNEKNVTFRWCFQPSFKESATKTKYNPVNETSKTSAESGEGQYVTQSSPPPNKKIKHFFHFKTPQFTVAVHLNDTTENSVSYNMIKEHTNNTNIMPIEPNTSTKRYGEEDEKLHRNFDPNSSSAIIRNKFQLETTTQKLHLNSTQVKSNVSIQVYRRGKVKKLLNKFYTEKMHLFSLNNKNSSKKGKNGTVVLNPEYADYIETKVETKTHKKYINKTVLHNAADVNDTSFNVMAYVMKPFDSLISVFKALSPNSVTKIGDVNATDIKNGSLPDHLQPPNSSIVILAVNNTNATSKDVHESKLEMALDLLGGMYHCMFNSFVEATPQDVHFYLYTRKNLEEPEELFLPQEQKENVTEDTHVPEPILEKELSSEMPHKRAIEYDEYDYGDYEFEPMNDAKSEIHSKWFNVRAETKVLIHGYLQDYQTDIMVTMKDAYLSQGPYNVVVVDWSVLVGDSSCYPVVASRGLRQVGDLLARLLDRLADAGASPSKMHVVGFSLGAHVAGHAGTFLSHGLLSRITGLDPALPYVPMEPNVSLDSGDAMFVDIIHSAAGLLGQSGPMGHIDFYPNGGSQQPGCEVSSLSCSHRRAALYFIESITSESGFPATRCDSWHHFQADDCSNTTILMGDPCPANSSGKFYLLTGYKSPFALQPQEHVQVKKSLLLDLFYESEDL